MGTFTYVIGLEFPFSKVLWDSLQVRTREVLSALCLESIQKTNHHKAEIAKSCGPSLQLEIWQHISLWSWKQQLLLLQPHLWTSYAVGAELRLSLTLIRGKKEAALSYCSMQPMLNKEVRAHLCSSSILLWVGEYLWHSYQSWMGQKESDRDPLGHPQSTIHPIHWIYLGSCGNNTVWSCN